MTPSSYWDRPAFWRGLIASLAHQMCDPHVAWLLLPAAAGLAPMLVRRLLPRWHRLYLLVVMAAMLTCAAVLWTASSRVVAGASMLIGVVTLMGATEAQAGEGDGAEV